MKKLAIAPVLVSFLMLASVSIMPVQALAAPTGTLSVVPGNITATVTGTVKNLDTNQTVELDYGLASNDHFELSVPITPDAQGNFSKTINQLTPSTAYDIEIFSSSSHARIGNVVNFKTVAGATTAGTSSSNADISIAFQLKNPLSGTSDLMTFLQNILKGIVLLLTPIVVIMMLYAGFLFVTAQGNAEKLGEAKKALLYTMIGAAIVLGAEGFATIIKNTVTCLGGANGC